MLRTGASADQEWSEEWFDSDYWRSLRPWLKEIARSSQRFGRFIKAALVARDEGSLTYRVSYDSVTRIVKVRVDGQGRIKGRMGRVE